MVTKKNTLTEKTPSGHGPMRKFQTGGFLNYEEYQTGVFKYPDAWPEPAMEWLVRTRPSGWSLPDLVQEIFDSGCHLAPVGRGKRVDEPIDPVNYSKTLKRYWLLQEHFQQKATQKENGPWKKPNGERGRK